MTEIAELPIGAGQRRGVGGGASQAEHDREPRQPPAQPVVLEAPLPAPEQVDLVAWEPRRLRRPLQLGVGKTVNWRMRKVTGLETRAGLMSDEQADAIADPLAEIFNRVGPLRQLAARQVEIDLGLAIWDYVQETAHVAARDVALAERAARDAAAERLHLAEEDGFRPPPPPIEGEVPHLDQ